MDVDGDVFISKLQKIGICGSQKLDSSSIDWIFSSQENKALKKFVGWFCENISASDVLSEQELQE